MIICHCWYDVDNIKMKSVGVFVYGDIGRSPRMQNHALELSKEYKVYFMGYFESSPKSSVLENENIKLVDIQISWLGLFRKISFYLYALVRVLIQIVQILYLLGWKYRGLQFVLVQNPPAIPNLFAIWLASKLSRFKIIVDFHNYGFTISNLTIKSRFVISCLKWYEKKFAKKANSFFCVSEQMRLDLKNNWEINAVTLYDRPVKKIKPNVDRDLFLKKYNQRPVQSDQLLLVSSTSWTPDQDFKLLLQALEIYDQATDTTKKVRTFITGRGPEKEKYMKLIETKQANWKKISVTALWLQADDYPILLSICDLGVCLHYSSSGLDLPMKVVDMYGAGIPVLAVYFAALPELVKDSKTGYVFNSKYSLAAKILELSRDEKKLKQLKAQVAKESEHTWQKQWQQKFHKAIK